MFALAGGRAAAAPFITDRISLASLPEEPRAQGSGCRGGRDPVANEAKSVDKKKSFQS